MGLHRSIVGLIAVDKPSHGRSIVCMAHINKTSYGTFQICVRNLLLPKALWATFDTEEQAAN